MDTPEEIAEGLIKGAERIKTASSSSISFEGKVIILAISAVIRELSEINERLGGAHKVG